MKLLANIGIRELEAVFHPLIVMQMPMPIFPEVFPLLKLLPHPGMWFCVYIRHYWTLTGLHSSTSKIGGFFLLRGELKVQVATLRCGGVELKRAPELLLSLPGLDHQLANDI